MTYAEFQLAICLTNMPLPLQLLWIVLRIRKEWRHMEHDLPVAKCLVQWVDARLAKLRVQTSTVPNHKRNNNNKVPISKGKRDKIKKKANHLNIFVWNLSEAYESNRFVYKLEGTRIIKEKGYKGMMIVGNTNSVGLLNL